MSDFMLIFWFTLMALGFMGSALFSGMETGSYRLNRVRLYVRSSQERSSAKTLERVINKPASLIGTLLIGNNLCNYAGTAGLGVLLSTMDLSVAQAVLVNTVLVTLVLFIFGETLPKDLFAAHSDRMMYPLARLLLVLRVLFTWTGILPAIVLLSTIAVRLTGKGEDSKLTPRKRVEQMVREGAGVGLISKEQTEIAQRALALSNQRLINECTPWQQVVTLSIETDRIGLETIARSTPRSRLPVLDPRGKVVGVVDLIDALALENEAKPIQSAMKPAVMMRGSDSVRHALSRMRREHIGLAIVTRPDGKPAGVITVKDLVETITGEIRNW